MVLRSIPQWEKEARKVAFAQTSVGWSNGDCQMAIPSHANWYSSDAQYARTFDNFTVPAGGWTVAGVFSLAGRVGFYRLQVDGLAVALAPGPYWLKVTPVVGPWTGTGAPSYVCATLGANAVGTRANGGAFYLATAGGTYFQPQQLSGEGGTSAAYGHGVLVAGGLFLLQPTIRAVVNSANWQGGAVAPGELVTITGSGLASTAASKIVVDPLGKVETALDGVQVTIGGVAAPETYMSSGQINAVVPYEVAGMASAPVVVKVAGVASDAFPVTVTAAAPAIFTADGSGKGQAAALNEDYSYNGTAHPAAKGGTVVLYVTGEGVTTSPVTGKMTTVAASAPYTPQPRAGTVTAKIGGMDAVVSFYGEAPGIVAGVMQVNVIVPPGVGPGDAAVVVAVGDMVTGAGVTVSVK